MNKARVIKSVGKNYVLLLEDKSMVTAHLAGKLRLADISHSNPVAVGDFVRFESTAGEEYRIVEVYERDNYIIRKSGGITDKNVRKTTHIIAANIDQVLLLLSLTDPQFSTSFIDRYTVTSEAYQIPIVLIFNKLDVYSTVQMANFEALKRMYTSIGYPVMGISLEQKEGLKEMEQLLKDKTTVISGHSGVGKSTLVNYFHPELNIKTKEVSKQFRKGQHTTTHAQMHFWPFGGAIIDTPGIKNFALVDMEKEEVKNYFPEFLERAENCKFPDCMHLNEPKCAVKEALVDGGIPEKRYESYLQFVEEETLTDEEKY